MLSSLTHCRPQRLGLTYVLRNAKQLPPAYDYSNMWPYERYLPDYDPTKYADLKREIHSQPIVRRRKHAAVSQSESEQEDDSSTARPWEKVDSQHRRLDNHHAHVLKNNALALNALYDSYPDVRPEAVRPEHYRGERLAIEERNQDRHHVKNTNRNWAVFHQKQVELRELQRKLDAVQEEIALWELREKAGWSPYLPPEVERELHERQGEKDRLELAMKRLVSGSQDKPHETRAHTLTPSAEEEKARTASLPLTPHFQEELEDEYESYHDYVLHHDYSVHASRLYRLECRFYHDESILEDLQRELKATKKESGELKEEEHKLIREAGQGRKYGRHSRLHEVKQRLHALQEKEADLATQVGHLENVREALDRRHRVETTPSNWSKDTEETLTHIGSSSSPSPPPPEESPQSSDGPGDSPQWTDDHPLLIRSRQRETRKVDPQAIRNAQLRAMYRERPRAPPAHQHR